MPPALTPSDLSRLSSTVGLLPAREAADLLAAIRAALPWTPNPGPQSDAYLSTADELYYGGAAGGGKTQLAIGLALTQHRNSLILRRQTVDTKGIVEAIRAIPGVGKWKQVGYGGELRTPDGRLIEIGGCQHEEDWQKYAGRPHDLIDLDELPQFTLKQYTMLTAWNRVAEPAKYPNQRCRVVGGGNPPLNPEGEWVLRRWGAWLDPSRGQLAPPGSLRYYATVGDEEREFPSGEPVTLDGRTYRPRSRTFVPARLEDNPALLGTGYDATLDSLPEPIRSALRFGDMTASQPDDRWQLIPRKWVIDAQKRWPGRAEAMGPLSALGVDVAMEGIDWTVLAPRHGATVAKLVKKRGKDTPDGQSVVVLVLAAGGGRDGGAKTNIDAIGVGKSAYDAARMMGLKNVYPVVVSESTEWKDPKVSALRFANLRAAMMWKVRTLLDPEGGPPETRLALPPDPELLADLTAARYKMLVSGVAVESKDDIRKRIGRSTDCGDAVALACWEKALAFASAY